MRKYLFLLAFTFIVPFNVEDVVAQKLVKNEVDKFTQKTTKQTSTEWLCKKDVFGSPTNIIMLSILKEGDNIQLLANLGTSNREKYTEDSGIMLLLENNDVVTLRTNFTGISSYVKAVHFMGPSSYIFNTGFTLKEEDVEKLSSVKVVSARINYMGGHQDFEIKKRDQDLLIRMFSIIK